MPFFETVKCEIQHKKSGKHKIIGVRLKGECYMWLPTFSFESCEDKDEIIVEVRELVELFEFLV